MMKYVTALRRLAPTAEGYIIADTSTAALTIATITRWPDGVAKPTPAELELESLKIEVREKRDSLMPAADVAVNKAIDSGVPVAPYSTYRQALRDIPLQAGFPTTINWPVAP